MAVIYQPRPAPPEDEFRLIVGEESRTYHYRDGVSISIKGVVGLCVRPSGNHRLETSDGRKWIIPDGWVAIELQATSWSC
jgi:hypothetical protein